MVLITLAVVLQGTVLRDGTLDPPSFIGNVSIDHDELAL
jgi:hypothetical protein